MNSMESLNVLSVDDDSDMHDGIRRILSRGIEKYKFLVQGVASFQEAIELLRTEKFDLIFLDVHEESSDSDPLSESCEQKGELVLSSLKEIRFTPVIFYTGYPQKVAALESAVVQVVDKGSTPDELRDAVRKILDTGLPKLMRYIEDTSRNFLWNQMETVMKSNGTVDSKEISILAARNLAKNLSQSSVKQLLSLDMEIIQPIEMYLYPPDSDVCSPGSICRKVSDNSLWMVMTPACDFSQGKASKVLLSELTPLAIHPLYYEFRNAKNPSDLNTDGDQNKVVRAEKTIKGDIKSLVKNKSGLRYRFLPGTFFSDDLIVDFQSLVSVDINTNNDYEILYVLDSPYREEMLQAFASYFGRIGTPDYDTDSVWEKIEQKLLNTD